MIYIDIDGVLVDFIGTARKFGVEMELNKFGKWHWRGQHGSFCMACNGVCKYPAAKKFYAKAELQPWARTLLRALKCELKNSEAIFLTKDYPDIKRNLIKELACRYTSALIVLETPDKSIHLANPTDLLIDDNFYECERWRKKGGIAYWLNLADKDPFGKFLKWWALAKTEEA